MKIKLEKGGKAYTANLDESLDISIPLSPDGPRAWYVDKMKIEPIMTERFTGSVKLGGAVNFRNIFFNPHGHGTHTETVGHIDEEIVSINQTLRNPFSFARLITIEPLIFKGEEGEYVKNNDGIITKSLLEKKLENEFEESLIIRTTPNSSKKLSANYSDTNPPYFEPEGLAFLRNKGVKHLLTDLPSVDRELDGGKLLAHRAFWHGGRKDDRLATITEFIFVPDSISDGLYLLNLQIAPFENDASPSKPLLFTLKES